MTILDPAYRVVLEARLLDAETKYHALMTGSQLKVFVDQNGERMEYNSASALQLSKYISELKRQLGIGAASGPLNVWM
jgi:hypothetical protein